MADDVSLIDGNDQPFTVAADNIGSKLFQRIKLIFGGDGTNDGDVSAANPLPVSAAVSSVAPGSGATNLGKAEDASHTSGDVGVMALGVRKDTRASTAGTDGDYVPPQFDANGSLRVVSDYFTKVTVSKTRPADTTTYASGDVINESTSAGTIYNFSNMALQNGGSGIITNVTCILGNNPTLKAVLELWLFDTTVAVDNDNTAFTPTRTELLTRIGVIPLTSIYVGDASANVVYSSGDISKMYKCASGDTSLYGMLVVRNAYVPASGETVDVIISAIQA